MKPQINADQGFKLRQKIYIDTPLRHFIEDQVLPNSPIDFDKFYETLSILVIEFGAGFRKLNLNDTIQNLQIKSKSSISTTILDEYCCEVPNIIITTLLAKISNQRIEKKFDCECLDKLILRIEEILPEVKLQNKSTLDASFNNSKVA